MFCSVPRYGENCKKLSLQDPTSLNNKASRPLRKENGTAGLARVEVRVPDMPEAPSFRKGNVSSKVFLFENINKGCESETSNSEETAKTSNRKNGYIPKNASPIRHSSIESLIDSHSFQQRIVEGRDNESLSLSPATPAATPQQTPPYSYEKQFNERLVVEDQLNKRQWIFTNSQSISDRLISGEEELLTLHRLPGE